ncbi:MAG TPA: ABC transporter permease [Puia sp.]|jgi:putative ABC transport system permease protein|nr:ABC transporter permease [Puia sp.]
MFKNYFKTAFRSLKHNKTYAAINVTGLAVGIAACLLIFLVIQFETSFDDFHTSRDRIYRIGSQFKLPDGLHYSAGTCFPAAKQLKLDYPQLENVSTILSVRGDQIAVMDEKGNNTQKKFSEQGLFFIEPHFLEMFNFPLLAGDAKTALAEPNTAIVTQATAERYFGDWKSAIGRTIKYNNNTICKITGVLKNLPANTDFPIEVALSLKTNKDASSDNWGSNNGLLNTFVIVPKGMSYEQLNRNLITFTKKHESAENAAKRIFYAQPLADIHFDKRFGNYNNRTISRELITTLSLIGLFLMIIACINFINLATAQAVNRAKEVGVRKVLGSRKKQLVWQFLSETFIITLVSVLFAIIIAYIALPSLNQLLKTAITVRLSMQVITFITGILILVTLLSGLYPAVILSGFNPITALKSKLSNNTVGGLSLRRALVILQFTVAQTLIIGTLIVVGQMGYFRNAPMGFDKDAVINIDSPDDSLSIAKREALKADLLRQPFIKDVSFGTFAIADEMHWGSNFSFNNGSKPVDFNADLKWSDADVFKTYGLQMVAGVPYRPSDTVREFVVNETLVKQLGIHNPQDILGKQISFWDGYLKGPVVGVVKDYNTSSMKDAFTPVVMAPWKYVYNTMAVKIESKNIQQTLAFIQKTWSAAYPEYVYKFQFLDDRIAAFYAQENQLSQLYKIFAGIAIFISCLGLYGLVSFMVVQRTKEIGVRKVLGASAGNIIYLFSKEFILLIAVAFAIAAPLAYYFMHEWLNNFSFRISIGAGVFVITIVSSIAIAWLTVSYQAFKAAMMNPVRAIRVE